MLRGGYYRGTTVLSSGGANWSASGGWRSQIAALTGELAESEDEIERFQAERDLRGMQSAAAREQIARLRWADQTAAEGPSQGTAENGKKPGDRDEGR